MIRIDYRGKKPIAKPHCRKCCRIFGRFDPVWAWTTGPEEFCRIGLDGSVKRGVHEPHTLWCTPCADKYLPKEP